MRITILNTMTGELEDVFSTDCIDQEVHTVVYTEKDAEYAWKIQDVDNDYDLYDHIRKDTWIA